MNVLARSIIGSPDTVRSSIDVLVAETGAGELMIVSDVYEHANRLRSFKIIASTGKDCLLTLPLPQRTRFPERRFRAKRQPFQNPTLRLRIMQLGGDPRRLPLDHDPKRFSRSGPGRPCVNHGLTRRRSA